MKKILIAVIGIAVLFTACKQGEKNEKEDKKNYRLAVKVEELKIVDFNHFIEVSGSIEALNDAFISPEMNGQIKKIYVEEGDYVQKGQKLAVLNTEVARKSIEELKTGLELAETMYKKQKKLWEDSIGSEIQFLQAKNNKETLEKKLETLNAQLEMSVITAPFSGMVEEVRQKDGEMGTPGFQIMQLVNLSKLKIISDVSEAYISKIDEGDTVHISFPSLEGYNFIKPIHRTGNVIKSGNRTFEIEIRLNNKNRKLKPNMICNIELNDYSNDSALIVPSIIIKKDLKGNFLFKTKEKEGKIIAEKVRVKTGKSYKDKTEILSGLKEGDKVIVKGYNLVSEGSELEIK